MFLAFTEHGSTLHCCWRHYNSTSWNMIQDELHHSEKCMMFLEDVAFWQAIRCPNVRFNHLTPTNVPPLISANYNHECELLSRNVKAVSIDNTAKCIWFPGHFDLGSRYNTFPYQGMDGMMPRKLCNKFHQDCEVYFFSRVLRDSTPCFVGLSVRPSHHFFLVFGVFGLTAPVRMIK